MTINGLAKGSVAKMEIKKLSLLLSAFTILSIVSLQASENGGDRSQQDRTEQLGQGQVSDFMQELQALKETVVQLSSQVDRDRKASRCKIKQLNDRQDGLTGVCDELKQNILESGSELSTYSGFSSSSERLIQNRRIIRRNRRSKKRKDSVDEEQRKWSRAWVGGAIVVAGTVATVAIKYYKKTGN